MKMRARWLVLLPVLVSLCGCAGARLRNVSAAKSEELAACRREITRLNERYERELKEKDEQIRELKEKLRNFGVF